MKWVSIYGNAQSKVMPHPAQYAKDVTLRYPILIPFKGRKIRIRLENFLGIEDVTIDKIAISIGDSLTDEINETIYLTFNGQNKAVIKAHGSVISDALECDLPMDKYVVISLYLADYTNLTSGVNITGPLTKGYFAYGNQIAKKKLDLNTSMKTNWIYFLTNVDIYTDDENYAIICYGDSITSQDWPDFLMKKIKAEKINNVSVVRKAVSGTRILREYSCITYQSYGAKGEKRFYHEVSNVCGAKKIIIQHGINDIIHPVGTEINEFRPMSDLPSLTDLKEGFNQYLNISHTLGLEAFVGTLVPIYNWRTYAPFREKLKNDFNNYLLLQNVIDFNNEIGQVINGEYHFKENCDSGDHLHPSKYAYELMANLAFKKLFK